MSPPRTRPEPGTKRLSKPAGKAQQFQSEAQAVVTRLQVALAEVVALIPQHIDKAADLERALSIRKTLAWQIYRMAHAPNPLVEGAKLPGQFAMQRFFRAASKAGVPEGAIAIAAKTFEEFGRVIKTHAGDRGTFESLVSGLTPQGVDHVELAQRRTAFKANSHIWGVQVKTQLSCAIMHPSANDTHTCDGLGLRGFLGVRRLRVDAPLVITRSQVRDNDGAARRKVIREPLDPDAPTLHGVTVLREFSSRPIPQLKGTAEGDGTVTIEVEGEAVGNQSRLTCFTGDVVRGALPRYRDEHNWCEIIRVHVRVPCEVLIHDVLLHEDAYGHVQAPSVAVFSTTGGEPRALPRTIDRLPMRVSVERLGKGSAVLNCADVPRYVEMVDYAMDRLGWDARKFDVYRCRVEYPVMPSSVVVQFDLPEKPGG